MPITVKKAGAHNRLVNPLVRKGSWRGAQKVYLKKSGAWQEVWPRNPNSPQSANINTSFDGSRIVVNTSWSAPAGGGYPYDRFITQLVFRHPNGVDEYPQGGIGHSSSTFAYTSLGQGNSNGWQHLAGWSVKVQVWAGRNATETDTEHWSIGTETPYVPVIQLPIPPAPTGVTTSMSSCSLTTSWTHAGSPALTGFEVQIWQWGYTPTTYTVGPSVRSFAGQPWDPNTVGRHGVSIQVRAMGTGGSSAWSYTDGIMPGPVNTASVHYNSGTLYVLVSGAYEGFHTWRDYYGRPTWEFQGTYPGNDGSAYWHSDTASSGYARDNVTQRRFILQPYNSANGWTGRIQGTSYAIKIPNPVVFGSHPADTWWSLPIPGKWRTNIQADNWYYQGKSTSGNSYGCLFYRNDIYSYFLPSRIGYTVTPTYIDVYMKRTNTGGLASAVALNIWTHGLYDNSVNAAPGLVNGPATGPSLARDQKAWISISTSWWANFANGSAKGIALYVDPSASDNQLRPEIGNVSNRYMIMDKPSYGSALDGYPPGTMRIYHGH